VTQDFSENHRRISYGSSQQRIHEDLDTQESAFNRLDALYQISKHLATFLSVEESFPHILACASKTFPLLTAVLIDNGGKKTKTAVWHSDTATHEHVVLATLNAREAFGYLTGSSISQSDDLKTDTATLSGFNKTDHSQSTDEFRQDNYIVLPLIIDNLKVIGALQLGGAAPLNENDLGFVDTLANLIAVALDRYYKSKIDQEQRKAESLESSARLTGSETKVADLENERDLREGFVSLLTHDLRTPLAAARMSAQLILKQQNDLVVSEELVNRIISNVNRADQMINNLLDANRIRSGERIPINVEPCDLSKLIKETLQELSTVHGDRFVYRGNETLEGIWDPRALRRIIENLCNNAIKYGDPKSPVTIRLKQNKGEVQLSVQNYGDLISPEDQISIFRQFKRSRGQSTKKKGWGIGLTLVRGVAEAHLGKVTVKSEADVGTVFTVTLPIDTHLESGD